MTQLRERKLASRMIRFGLVALAIVIAATWALSKADIRSGTSVRVEGQAPPIETLAAGDVQIFNEDSTVDVILAGDRLSAGLSPQKLEEVRADIARSSAKDTSGIGGSIAQVVKKTVADKISIRAVYPLADIRDLRYEDDGRLILEWRNGKETTLLGDNVRVDNDRDANKFRRDDAERLIAAVRARLR
jgi:hypothetical protein